MTAESKKNTSLVWICGFKSSGPESTRKNTKEGQRFGGNREASLLPSPENNVLHTSGRRNRLPLVVVPRESSSVPSGGHC